MRTLELESKLISKAVYDEDNNVLYITFYSGTEWKYLDVPQEVITSMMNNISRGSYFVKYIKPVFKAEQV